VTRLLMLVEGPSEEAFVKRTLAPWLARRDVYVQGPVVLWTRRLVAGGGYRGGASSWTQVRRSLDPLLGDTDAWVTTLLDFYALPGDVPDVAEHRGHGEPIEQVRAVQAEMKRAVGERPRFVPFLVLHEFEAWLLADPAAIATHFGEPALAARIDREVAEAGGPEAVNHGHDTHPKARLQRLCPSYKETSDGPTVLGKIGIERIRARCPHFDGWLAQIEQLGAPR
jgi:hypothetical protein